MSAPGQPGHPGLGNVIYFLCEKKSPYTASWTMRRCAFNCDTRYLYYSSKALNLSSPWKKVMKVTAVSVPAEAADFDVAKLFVRDNNTDGDHSERNLYTFLVQGVYRNIMAHTSPPTNVMPNATSFERANRGWPSKHSPRGDSYQHDKTVLYTWRCDSAALLHKLVDTMRDVLADDGLCPPVNAGLPLCDPRNGLPLAHIPLYLGKPFKGLEQTVFYAFACGDLVGRNPATGQIGNAIAGGYLCITDRTVLLMRPDGTVPRWCGIAGIERVEYNTAKAKLPFLAILAASPAAADIVFVPAPPQLTSEERRAYNAGETVQHLVHVLQRVNRFLGGTLQVPPHEDASPSVRLYVEGKDGSSRPLRFVPQEGYKEPLAYPLPKAQLAKVLEAQRATGQQPQQYLQQQHRLAPKDAPKAAANDTPTKVINVGEVGLCKPHTQGVALHQAASVSCSPSAGAGQRHHPPPQVQPQPAAASSEEVRLPAKSSDSSTVDVDLADPDLDVPAEPTRAQGTSSGVVASTVDVDDIELSDSLDDLILDDPAVAAPHGSYSSAPPPPAAGTTLEELINQSFAMHR